MARHPFAGDVSSWAARTSGGIPIVAAVPVKFYNAATGGAQYTDLLDTTGNPATFITTDAYGQIPAFQGPDGVIVMWADGGGASRQSITATDVDARALTAATPALTTAAWTSGSLAIGVNTVDATGGAKTPTLPTPTKVGQLLTVEKTDASTNAVTVSGTIRGSAGTLPLTYQYQTVVFQAESLTSWRPFADHRTAAQLNSAYHQDRQLPAARMSVLPDQFYDGQYGYNGYAAIQDNVTTANGVQWAVAIKGGGGNQVALYRRTLPDGVWAAFRVDNLASSALVTQAADTHNSYSVAVSSDGYIHIIGNEHANTLRYIVCSNVGSWNSSGSWAAGTLTGSHESAITYPAFLTLPDGTLLLFYRDGVSGDGDYYVDRYNATTHTWSQLGCIITGSAVPESPYPNHIFCDTAGDVHVFYCWRGSANSNTNSDFCYLRLTGLQGSGTLAGRNSSGSTVSLPVNHTNSEKIIATAASDSGLMNTHGADIDTAGRLHAAQWLLDGSSKMQLIHVWFDGTWHQEQVTNLTQTVPQNVSIVNFTLARASVVCSRTTGRTYMIGRVNYDGRKGTIRAWDVTPGGVHTEFILARLEGYEWEPTFDTRALVERDELHMLFIPCVSAGSSSGFWNNANNWQYEAALMLTYDMKQMPLVAAGEAQLPRLRIIGTAGTTSTTAITSTSDVQAGPPVMIGDGHGRTLFARLKCNASSITGTFSVSLKAQVNGTGNIVVGQIDWTSASQKEGPWVRLYNLGVAAGEAASVYPVAHVTAAGTAIPTWIQVEVAELEGPGPVV